MPHLSAPFVHGSSSSRDPAGSLSGNTAVLLLLRVGGDSRGIFDRPRRPSLVGCADRFPEGAETGIVEEAALGCFARDPVPESSSPILPPEPLVDACSVSDASFFGGITNDASVGGTINDADSDDTGVRNEALLLDSLGSGLNVHGVRVPSSNSHP